MDKVNTPPIPDRVSSLIDRVCELDPEGPFGSQRAIGVTPEIAQELQDLTTDEIEALVIAHNTSHKPPFKRQRPPQQQWATRELLSHVGPRAIPFLAQALEIEKDDHVKGSLIAILGNIGEPALKVLDDYFPSLTDTWLARRTVAAFFNIGEPATHLTVFALGFPDSEIPDYIMGRITIKHHSDGDVEIGLINAIATSIIDRLIAQNPNRPNYYFNDEVVAECLRVTTQRNPQLRRQIQTRLCALAFQDDLEVRERAIQVAANFDISDFLQLVRTRATEDPNIAAEIMYRLGRSEPLPTQQQSLGKYISHLQALEDRTLTRWDEMAKQSKINFWLRNGITSLFVIISAGLIALGVYLVLTADDNLAQGIAGGSLTILTTLGSMLTKFWKEPVKDIRSSFRQQAAVEATLIGFMTRVGQIRLVFEQNFAKAEMGLEDLSTYQTMIADVQKQTAQELELIGRADFEPKVLETSKNL